MTLEKLLAEKWKPKYGMWAAAVVLSGFLAWYWDSTLNAAKAAPPEERVAEAATFIPAGYVLVPIEIANSDSLDSILGNFGVVDLYVPSDEPSSKPRRVAYGVKILRAPLNPNVFAVLVEEAEAPRIVAHAGPFTVVVQNPSRQGTKFENTPAKGSKKRKGSRVEVEVVHAENP